MRRVLEIVLDAEGTVGGTQKHVAQIVEGLDPNQYQADVVTWEIPQFVAHLRERDVDVLPVRGTRILDIGLVRRIRDRIESVGYDVIHAHGHRAGLIGRLAAIRARVPAVIWTCHLPDNKADRNVLLARTYAAALRRLDARTDATIAVSRHVRDWLLGRGIPAGSIRIIYNCVDTREFSPRQPSARVLDSLGLPPAESTDVVGTVARLTDQKGLDCLLDAVPLVLAIRPAVRFVIVGGGPLEAKLKQQATDLGVTESVIFAGERDDVADVMSVFDVAVLPSRSEGFSYVPLEVMACAKPLVCSDIAPFREIVSDGENGLIFPLGSARDLAEAILRLLDDRVLATRLAEAGHELVRREFDLPAMLRHTVDVYDCVLAGKAG